MLFDGKEVSRSTKKWWLRHCTIPSHHLYSTIPRLFVNILALSLWVGHVIMPPKRQCAKKRTKVGVVNKYVGEKRWNILHHRSRAMQRQLLRLGKRATEDSVLLHLKNMITRAKSFEAEALVLLESSSEYTDLLCMDRKDNQWRDDLVHLFDTAFWIAVKLYYVPPVNLVLLQHHDHYIVRYFANSRPYWFVGLLMAPDSRVIISESSKKEKQTVYGWDVMYVDGTMQWLSESQVLASLVQEDKAALWFPGALDRLATMSINRRTVVLLDAF